MLRLSKDDPGAETGPRQATAFTRLWYWAFLVMGFILFLGGVTPWEPASLIADLPSGLNTNLYGSGINWNDIIHILLGLFIGTGAVVCLIGAQYRNRIDE